MKDIDTRRLSNVSFAIIFAVLAAYFNSWWISLFCLLPIILNLPSDGGNKNGAN